jgi:8-oxo-dGTP pyrophosphatase MutT (NUDIX family)
MARNDRVERTAPAVTSLLDKLFGYSDITTFLRTWRSERQVRAAKDAAISKVLWEGRVPQVPPSDNWLRKSALVIFPFIVAAAFFAIDMASTSGGAAMRSIAGFVIGGAFSLYVFCRDWCRDDLSRRGNERFASERVARWRVVNFSASARNTLSSLKLPEAYDQSGYQLCELVYGFGFWSPKVTDWLLSGEEVAIRFDDGLYCDAGLDEDVVASVHLNHLRGAQTFRNDEKIRLRSDLVGSPGKWPKEICFQRTNYLTTACTNDLAFCEVFSTQTRKTEYDGKSHFIDSQTSVFRGYQYSQCANQLGTSTIAFTSDGHLILIDQTSANIQSSGLLAPSGSGSLDWSDRLGKHGSPARSLGPWLAQASLRELREEIGVDAHCHGISEGQRRLFAALEIDTVPIGFGGFLHRGGKPEFFFVAVLNWTFTELSERRCYATEEKLLSRPLSQTDAYVIDTSKDDLAAETRRALGALSASERYRLSFPLELGMIMLNDVAERHPDQVRRLFNKR